MKDTSDLSVDLTVHHVSGTAFSTMTLEFPEEQHGVIRAFDPERLYLEDVPGDRYGLVDAMGHRYCGVVKHDEWMEAARDRGLFFLVMQSTLSDGVAVGRVMIVQYPFGHIIKDTEVFQISAWQFATAVLDGQLIRQAIAGADLDHLDVQAN